MIFRQGKLTHLFLAKRLYLVLVPFTVIEEDVVKFLLWLHLSRVLLLSIMPFRLVIQLKALETFIQTELQVWLLVVHIIISHQLFLHL